MKGGVALALVGLLAVVMGVRGTYKQVWAALSGATPATVGAGISPATGLPVIPGFCAFVKPDGSLDLTRQKNKNPDGTCPDGYTSLHTAPPNGGTGFTPGGMGGPGPTIYYGGAFQDALPNMPGAPTAQF